MSLKYSLVHRTAVGNALIADIGASAKLRVYTGTRPTSVDTALSGNTMIVELPCAATFGTMTGGVMTANAVSSAAAAAAGTATFYRLFKNDGTTAVVDGDVAASGADLNLAGGTTIGAGATISVSSYTITPYGA